MGSITFTIRLKGPMAGVCTRAHISCLRDSRGHESDLGLGGLHDLLTLKTTKSNSIKLLCWGVS